MTRIVTTHYRYKPPPRKRKAVTLKALAVTTYPPSRLRSALFVTLALTVAVSGVLVPDVQKVTLRKSRLFKGLSHGPCHKPLK
jgi:hypothetical protein